MITPKLTRTYGKYSKLEVGSKGKSIACTATRIDIVFDVYKVGSRD